MDDLYIIPTNPPLQVHPYALLSEPVASYRFQAVVLQAHKIRGRFRAAQMG